MLGNYGVFSKIKSLNYMDLLIFLIPLIVFSYYLHVYYPGIMVYDSYNQLHQIAIGKFNNWHPFCHTFIEMICLNVYRSPSSVAILQIITFSTFWMIICKYNRDDSQKTNLSFILQLIITLTIALIPINAIFSINLQKDILFSYFLMFLCFLMEILIDNEGKAGYPLAIAVSIVMAFVAQLRTNGMILVIVFLIVLPVWIYIKNKDFKLSIIIPALSILFILLIASLNIVYDVKDNQNDPLRDIVPHMLADYSMSLDLDSTDQIMLHKLMGKQDLDKYYNIYFKDPTRNHIVNRTVWKNDKNVYIDMAVKYSLRHPSHFIGYMFNSAPLVWDITRGDDWSSNYGVIDMDYQKQRFYSKNNVSPATDFDNASAVNVGTSEYQNLNHLVNAANDNLVLDTLFNSPALYMYLALIILLALYWITRLNDLWLVYLPNMLNILIVFVSIPAQQNRYLYPNLLVCYLLIIMLVRVLIKRKSEAESGVE